MQNLEQFAVKSAQKIAPELCKKSLGKNPSESFFCMKLSVNIPILYYLYTELETAALDLNEWSGEVSVFLEK